MNMTKRTLFLLAGSAMALVLNADENAGKKSYSIDVNDGWTPITMRKGIVPGGATDFSGWKLQDAPAGKYGWLKRDGAHFKFENGPEGSRVKFYGANLVGGACWPEKAKADEIVARFVRSGYNTVRLHHIENAVGLTTGTDDPTCTALNPEKLDKMDYLVSKCIEAGLYVTIDLYSCRSVPWKELGIDKPGKAAYQQVKPFIYMTDAGFENWKKYVANLLNHVNPYTGRAYKDEPGMPLLCLVNEGALTQAWRTVRELPLVKDAVMKALGRDTHDIKTANPDFVRFSMDVETNGLPRMISFVRSLGAKALLTDMNNGPHPPEKQVVREKYLDYYDNHVYIDHPKYLGKRLKPPFRYRNIDILDYPESGKGISRADLAAAVRIPSMPYTITEWNFCAPSEFRYQGGLYMAALASRGKWDGLWRFDYAARVSQMFDGNDDVLGFFCMMVDPVQHANERALVSLYLRGDAPDGAEVSKIDREKKTMTVDTPRTQGGFARAGGEFGTSGLTVRLADANAAVWATSVDGKPLAESSRILVTHLTDVQNTGTRWKEAERRTVLKRGKSPLLARSGTAEVKLTAASGEWKAYALDTDGTRRGEVPVSYADGRIGFTASTARDPANATILYELVR